MFGKKEVRLYSTILDMHVGSCVCGGWASVWVDVYVYTVRLGFTLVFRKNLGVMTRWEVGGRKAEYRRRGRVGR